MAKRIHEIRDPIHVFVRLDSDERRVLASPPLQRLRHIHQLALTYLVYPGATHRRFEHSLGVMELADRVFGVVTRRENVSDGVRNLLPEINYPDNLGYWRRVLRMAALCHDVGHLPFSHAAEAELLPDGWDHERLTREIILDKSMRAYWEKMTPPLRPEDIVKLAIGPKKAADLNFSDWETILAEVIVGDAFGVDRMDYLLRDAYHAGVVYGRFDHYRLIDTLRILPPPPTDEDDQSLEPVLGIQQGGRESAEALLLARYFMYSQVYFHSVRRIYDIHLKDFLRAWLPNGHFPTPVKKHLAKTDNEVTTALFKSANSPKKPGHDPARRIVHREHFKVLYERHPDDARINPEAGQAIYEAAMNQFGEENVRYDRYRQEGSSADFPVQTRDDRIVSSRSISEVLSRLPLISVDYVFVNPDILKNAQRWLESNRNDIIEQVEETE